MRSVKGVHKSARERGEGTVSGRQSCPLTREHCGNAESCYSDEASLEVMYPSSGPFQQSTVRKDLDPLGLAGLLCCLRFRAESNDAVRRLLRSISLHVFHSIDGTEGALPC